MYLHQVRDILDAKVIWGEEHLDRELRSACGSDYMSDVLAYVKNQALLLTGLVNPQVVRTAEVMDIKCVVFLQSKTPDEVIVRLAREREIVLMTTPQRMYTACGLLYINGLAGE